MKKLLNTKRKKLIVFKSVRQIWIDEVLNQSENYCADYVQWVQGQVNVLDGNIKRLEGEE